MTVAKQQSSWHYVLFKIDRVYTSYQAAAEKRKLRAIRKQRRQLISAKSAFQKELDKAVSIKVQAGLGMKVTVDQKRLPQLHLLVRFEFLGKQWLLTSQRSLLRDQWQLSVDNQPVFAHCPTRKLENQLCYALGKYKHTICHKVKILTLLPLAEAS